MTRVYDLLREPVDDIHPTWYMVFGRFIDPRTE